MFKLAWRNIIQHKVRMLLTMLGVILGVSLTLAVGILNQSMRKTFEDISMRSGGKTDIILYKNNGFTSSDVKYIKNLENVILLAPMCVNYIKAPDSSGEKIEIGVKGVDINKDRTMRDYSFIEGEWFSGENKREVIMDEKSASRLGVKYGGSIRLITNTGEKSYRVAGIISTKGAGLPAYRPEMYSPLMTITSDQGYAGRYFRLDIDIDNNDMINPIAEKLKNHFGDVADTQTLTDRLRMAKRNMGGIDMGFSVVLAVVIFVGCFLIYNTFMVIVLERIQLIGVLKTLGMDRKQTVKLILVEGLLMGIIGSAIGISIGSGVALGLLKIMSKSLDVAFDQFAVYPYNYISATAVGLIMPLISCYIPAKKASKYSPIEALKVTDSSHPLPSKKHGFMQKHQFKVGAGLFICSILIFEVFTRYIKSDFVSNVIMPLALLLLFTAIIFMTPTMLEKTIDIINMAVKNFFSGKTILSIKNLMRNKGRSSITVSIIIIGITMSVGFSGMFNSIKESVGQQIGKSTKADIVIQKNFGQGIDNFEKYYNQLRKLAGVDIIYYNRMEGYRDENKEYNVIVGIKANEHKVMSYFDLLEGNTDEIYERISLREKVTVIGDYYSKNLGYNMGDTIWLRGKNKKYPFTIVGIVSDPIALGKVAYIDRDILNSMYGGKYGNLIGIKVIDGVDIDALREKIRRDIIKDESIDVSTAYEYREMIKKDSISGTEVFDIINVITLVVSLFGLMNTLLMSIFERQREIGMLRSIGSTKNQVRKMIFGESIMMGLYSAAVGISAGMLFAREARISMESLFDVHVELYLPYGYIILSAIAVFACAFGAALYPSYVATKANIVDAIKGE